MAGVTEKLLEDEVTENLVADGGYRICKIGTDPRWRPDFDASRDAMGSSVGEPAIAGFVQVPDMYHGYGTPGRAQTSRPRET